MRAVGNEMTAEEFMAHFLEIIRPLDYEVLDHGQCYVYLKPPPHDKECARGISVMLTSEPTFIVNQVQQYCYIYFEFIWDDERHEPEDMNSDMALAITNDFMKVLRMIICLWTKQILMRLFRSRLNPVGIVFIKRTVNGYGDEWTFQ